MLRLGKGLIDCMSSLNTPAISHGVIGYAGILNSQLFQYQQARFGHKYRVNDGSIKWLRRRAKALEQRLKVLNPSTPVIDQRTPLPLTNEGRYPTELFGAELVRNEVEEAKHVKGVVAEINRQVEDDEVGRMFAVIQLKGKQFKITAEDILIIQGYWAPDIGDRIRMHKVLLAGSKDFTLIGKPLLDHNMIRIEGTVIEKTMSYLKLHFRLLKRKNYRRLKFAKDPYTMVRINMIEMLEGMEDLQLEEDKVEHTVDGDFSIANVRM